MPLPAPATPASRSSRSEPSLTEGLLRRPVDFLHQAVLRGRRAAGEPVLRRAFLAGVCAAVLAVILSLIAQVLLLGAWRIGATAPALGFGAAPAASLQALPTGEWRLPPDQAVGGIVANALAIDARTLPGLQLRVEAHRAPVDIEVGWTRLAAGDRPATLRFRVPPSLHDHTVRLQLAGARGWNGTVTRLAFVVRAPAAGTTLTLTAPEPIPATPGAALAWWVDAAFADRPALLGTEGDAARTARQAERVLPAAVWLALASGVLWLGYAVIGRRSSPRALAMALLGSASTLVLVGMALGVAMLMLQVLPARSTLLGLLATGALVLAASLEAAPRPTPVALAVGALGAALLVLVWLAPGPGVATAIAAAVLAAPERQAWRVRSIVVGALLVLALALGAHAQGLTAAFLPSGVLPLRDPTGPLLAFLPWALPALGVLFGALLLASQWPRGASPAALDTRALVAAFAYGSGVLLALALGEAGETGFLLPLALLVALTLRTRLVAPLPDQATATEATVPLTERSAAVQALYRAATNAFLDCAARRELREALRHLDRMQEIAPEQSDTHWARLALTLAGTSRGDAAEAAGERSYRLLAERLSAGALTLDAVKPEQVHFTLFEAAWPRDDLSVLASLASCLPEGLTRLRTQARLALAQGGAPGLWRWLGEQGFPPELVLERIECALLIGDLEAAKSALDASGIPLASPAGQCYYLRLLLRVRGPAATEAEILKQVTWQPDLAPAQMAMAELLAAQGKRDAARVRLAQAERCEAAFWPGVRAAR